MMLESKSLVVYLNGKNKAAKICFLCPDLFCFSLNILRKPHGLLIDRCLSHSQGKCVIFIVLTNVNIHFTFNSAGFIGVIYNNVMWICL